MPDQHPAPMWPDGMTPTVDQLRTWLHRHQPGAHDARIAADMILTMYADEHAANRVLVASLVHQERRAERFRAAWLSARRRARTAYADGYADGMLEA